jgi:predicted metalloprotease with PDZ domain
MTKSGIAEQVLRHLLTGLLLLLALVWMEGRSAWGLTAPARAAKGLSITLRPFTTPENVPAFEVELSFPGNERGREVLVLPSSWGGQEKLYRAIDDIQPLSPRTSIKDLDTPDRKAVEFPAGSRVRLSYTVTQDWKQDFSEHIFRPALSPDSFTMIGTSFLVLPDWNEETARPITMDWEIPPEWTQADSFGVGRGKARSFSASLSQLQTAIYVGGDYRLHSFTVRGRSVNVALRGKWRFTDAQFSSLAQRVIDAERTFWKDDAFPYFLITLTPTDEPGQDYQGTGLTNSFAAYADKQVDLATVPGLKHLLAHELFHTWNPLKLSREGQFPEPQERHFWFGEGFTEYYAHQVLLRSGMVSQKEYFDQLNERIRAYYLSSVRNAPNRRIEKEFFTSDAVGKLAYQRGELLAIRWNALIRSVTGGQKSLDDVMHDLRRDASRYARLRPEQAVAAVVQTYAKRDVSSDIARYITVGETIPLPADAFGPNVIMTPKKVSASDGTLQTIPQYRTSPL